MICKRKIQFTCQPQEKNQHRRSSSVCHRNIMCDVAADGWQEHMWLHKTCLMLYIVQESVCRLCQLKIYENHSPWATATATVEHSKEIDILFLQMQLKTQFTRHNEKRKVAMRTQNAIKVKGAFSYCTNFDVIHPSKYDKRRKGATKTQIICERQTSNLTWNSQTPRTKQFIIYSFFEKKDELKLKKGISKCLLSILNSIILHSSISFECNPIAFSDYFRFVWKCFVFTQIDGIANRLKKKYILDMCVVCSMRCAKCCGFVVSLSQTFETSFFPFFWCLSLLVFILGKVSSANRSCW